jgi:sulfur carrier protein
MVTIVVNGSPRPLPYGGTVADLVAEIARDAARPGVAVAVNDTVVPRRTWKQRTLQEGDRVEVLGAAQGG